ncbi:MAG: dual specificity protein phosphatase family protein [Planctomycetes bacterium]|nr:dual specificity protein phosphatase family protein [Planctomycetota bacterium]
MKADVLWVMDRRIAILPRPRGGDWLEDEIASYAQQGVQVLLSLLEPAEELELGLFDEVLFAEKFGLDFMRYAIPDRGVPRSPALFAATINDLANSGKAVGVHCRAGIGRSGLAAAAMLVRLGHEVEGAFAQVGTARGVAVPDTPEQRQWLVEHRGLFAG